MKTWEQFCKENERTTYNVVLRDYSAVHASISKELYEEIQQAAFDAGDAKGMIKGMKEAAIVILGVPSEGISLANERVIEVRAAHHAILIAIEQKKKEI